MLPKASVLLAHRYIAANFLFLIFSTFGSQILHNTYMYATDFTIGVCLKRGLDELQQYAMYGKFVILRSTNYFLWRCDECSCALG